MEPAGIVLKFKMNHLGDMAMVIRCTDPAHVKVIVVEAELAEVKVRFHNHVHGGQANISTDSDMSFSRRSSQAPRASSRHSRSYDSVPDWQESDQHHSNMQSRTRSRSNTSRATLRQEPPPVDDYDMFDKEGLRVRVREI